LVKTSKPSRPWCCASNIAAARFQNVRTCGCDEPAPRPAQISLIFAAAVSACVPRISAAGGLRTRRAPWCRLARGRRRVVGDVAPAPVDGPEVGRMDALGLDASCTAR
jgi:hypothetical protein